MIVTHYSQLIGNTPLLELVKLSNGTRYLLKLEQFNPTGSMKIRMARKMVMDALSTGQLRPGGRIVESTSGNTGVGLSVIAAELGLSFTAIVDNHAAPDKIRAMKALGTEVVCVTEDGDDSLHTALRDELAGTIAAQEPGTIFTEQHNNASNPAGYSELAHELLQDLAHVEYLVCAVGTGGSLCGTARELRAQGQHTTIIGVEPVGSIIFGGHGSPYWQSGTGTPEGAEVGSVVDYSVIDRGVKVSDCEAFAAARVLGRRTGLMVGGSSGGCVWAAAHMLTSLPAGSTVVTIICDGGEKYLDTVFDDEWMRHHDLLSYDTENTIENLFTDLGISSGQHRPIAVVG